jgi:hypothetical protein
VIQSVSINFAFDTDLMQRQGDSPIMDNAKVLVNTGSDRRTYVFSRFP